MEFALVLPLFLLFILAVIDGGRAIFAYNQVSQATRDVARVASVNCFVTATRCDSAAAGQPIATAISQQAVGMQGPVTWTVQCVNPNTQAVASPCTVGSNVRVRAVLQFQLIFGPLQAAMGPIGVESTSEQEILQ